MNPTRRRRLLLVLLLVVASAVAVTLVALALQRNVAYLYTPSEVLDGKAGASVADGQARFRLGGMVAAGSFKRASGSLDAHFDVDDGDARMPVVYRGILPDLFREGHGTVVQGRIGTDGVLAATQVLAKHDENYMPPEAADAIQRAGETVVQ